MDLLVSLCSRTAEAPTALLRVRPERSVVEPVALIDPAMGAFGLSATPGAIYAVIDLGRVVPREPERSRLLALHPNTLEEMWSYPFRIGRDVHSLAARGDRLTAASTGTDEIIELTFGGGGHVASETVIWSVDPQERRADHHHLNGVAWLGADLIVCGFGPSPSPGDWRLARGGSVQRLDGTDVLGPLYHPHSPTQLSNDEVAVCESPRRRIVTTSRRISEELPGYARGLCAAGKHLYVGTSRARHPGEPRSLLPYEGSSEDGIASICILDRQTLKIEDTIDITPHGREVYDIIQLDADFASLAELRQPGEGADARALDVPTRAGAEHQSLT